MKILCVIDSLGSGGAQRQLVNLAKGFKEKGHVVSFLVYHSDGFYREELKQANIEVTYILESHYLMRLIKMRRYIRNGNYDSVLSFLTAASFITTIAGFPYRRWTLVVGERSANPKILKSFKLRFYRIFHMFADYIVANSQANIDIVKKANPLLPSDKMHVIYNMLALDKVFNERNNVKQQWYKNENRNFHLIVAASHRKLKNLNGLVEAVNLLPEDKKRSFKVDWYGEKDLDTSLSLVKLKIEEYMLNDVFSFFDSTPNIYKRISEADASGLFSFHEGFPNFVCESMFIGKPIVCTNVSDLPLFLEDNINVFFCNASNPSSIANAIERLMDMSYEKCNKMVQSNIEIANNHFNKEVIVDSYLKLLEP